MSNFPVKTLNKISSFVLQFDSVYIVPQRRSASFPGHSPRPHVVPKPQRSTTSKVVFSAPRPEPTLDQLAHQATRPVFEVYPDLRSMGCAYSMFGRKPHNFLYTQKVNTPSQDLNDQLCLKELNRMARLVEITSSHCPVVPIYFDTPRLSKQVAYNRVSHMVIAELLRFTKNGFAVCDFSYTFPGTAAPKVAYFSGQPRIDKQQFNELLSSKLSSLRSRLGVNSTPSGAPALVASWINRLLRRKTPITVSATEKPASKENKRTKTTSAISPKAKRTKVEFTVQQSVDSSSSDLKPTSLELPVPSTSKDCTCGIPTDLCFVHSPTPLSAADALLCLRELRRPLKLFKFFRRPTCSSKTELDPVWFNLVKALTTYFNISTLPLEGLYLNDTFLPVPEYDVLDPQFWRKSNFAPQAIDRVYQGLEIALSF